jgi:hypothetical protein
LPVHFQPTTATQLGVLTVQSCLPARTLPLRSEVLIERSKTTVFFSVFVVCCLWAISSATMVYMLDIIFFRPRQ